LTPPRRGSRVFGYMPARFQVKHSFAIERRHLFVLVGTPVEGAVTAGMQAAVPVSAALSLSIPIHGVEVMRRGGGESVALTSRYSGPEELDVLRGLDLGGSILDIAEEDAATGLAIQALPALPVVCALSSAALRKRREGALRTLREQAQEIREILGGYSLRFPASDALLDDLMQVIQMERKCCAFLLFSLVVTPGEGPVWLEMTGPEGTQELLRGILNLPAPRADLEEKSVPAR
jgi:hypothetical protein